MAQSISLLRDADNIRGARAQFQQEGMHISIPVPNFLAEFSAAHRAFVRARALYAPEVSPDFHPLGLFKITEMNLSKILGWMLDPRGNHCQGPVFLEEFLIFFNISPPDDPFSAGVTLEQVTTYGRLDIVIQLSDNRKIVIENKPYAADQYQQLERYLKYVGARGHVVYLPGTNRQASELSIRARNRDSQLSEGKLIESSWIELIPYFEMCRNVCRAPRVRNFIQEIPRYARATFEGVTDLTETKIVVENLIASPDAVESAFIISNAMDEMKKSLLCELTAQIRAELPEGWSLEGELWSKQRSLYIDYPNSAVRFYAGFDRSNTTDFSYGLEWKAGTKIPSQHAISRALAEIGVEHERSQKQYPVWKWADERDEVGLPQNWALMPLPWKMIVEKRAGKNLVKAVNSHRLASEKLDALVHGQ